MPVELTRLASHLHTIADTLRASFGTMQLGEYTIEMTVPEQSTKGGLLAMQHVVLRPKQGMSIVIGAVRVVEKSVELRSYGHVHRTYEQRFKKSPSFDATAYSEFIDRARTVFANFALEVRVVDPATTSIAPEPPAKPARNVLRPFLLALCVLALAALALAFLRQR